MTRLEELLYSLATVIVRYHDGQSGVKKIVTEKKDNNDLRQKSRNYAESTIRRTDTNIKVQLEQLIKESTDGYTGRRPFLSFLLEQIIFLKSLHDRTINVNETNFADYTKQISELLIYFRTLVTTPKSGTISLKYQSATTLKEVDLTLKGLKNDGWSGPELCFSGFLLKEEVLSLLNIETHFTDEEITTIAIRLCTEYFNEVQVPELKNKNGLLAAENDSLREEVARLKLELAASKQSDSAVDHLQKAVTIREDQILAYKGQIAVKDEEISSLKGQVATKDEEVSSLKVQISALRTQNRTRGLIPGLGFFGLERYNPPYYAPSRQTTEDPVYPDSQESTFSSFDME